MVRSVEHYPPESIVLVKGKIRRPPQAIKNATIHDAEIDVLEIHLLSHLTENVPFTVYDAQNIAKFEREGEKDGDNDGDDEESETGDEEEKRGRSVESAELSDILANHLHSQCKLFNSKHPVIGHFYWSYTPFRYYFIIPCWINSRGGLLMFF
jgi:hypothetical protein